ncbi:hypothetical protein MUB52_20855 [Roseobacter sp. WL0113]|uniref:Uncharacterized protein n=1 Tax=Roseobacter sinensis TaxID=2931391 RepID=A0ABT3BJZ9_9RHOB|nr:hypothetical protein [Roseobacter sp. WL0113]MCV3273891.1 hypothetical protein [Roseobacter sp. WL0113]
MVLIAWNRPVEQLVGPTFGIAWQLTWRRCREKHPSNGLFFEIVHAAVLGETGHDSRAIEARQTRFKAGEMHNRRVGVSKKNLWVLSYDANVEMRPQTNGVVAAN